MWYKALTDGWPASNLKPIETCNTDVKMKRCASSKDAARKLSRAHLKLSEYEEYRLDSIKSNIRSSRLYDTSLTSLSQDEYVDVFDNEVRRLLDDAAPIRTAVKRPALNDFRWRSDEARAAKRNCRRLERRYFRARSDANRRAYRTAQRSAKQAVTDSRTAHFKSEANMEFREGPPVRRQERSKPWLQYQ